MIKLSCLNIVLLSYILTNWRVTCPDLFCSIFCSNRQCNSIASNDCKSNKCRSPFFDDGTSCVVDPDVNSYVLVASTGDVGIGNPLGNPSTDTCGSYSFYGFYTSDQDTITFTDSVGIAEPHFRLRIMFWAILVDDWRDGDFARVKFDDSISSEVITENRKDNIGAGSTNLCDRGNNEDFYFFNRVFDHDSLDDPYTITIFFDNNKDQPWGIKQLLVLVQKCHWACETCFESSVNQCYTCNQDYSMKLSGTTCNETCLPGYGDTIAGEVCVKCDPECVQCFQDSFRCQSCQPSGTYRSFLYVVSQSCVNPCPDPTFGNYTSDMCQDCNPECLSCQFRPDYCYECDKSIGYAWNSYTCYNPCPIGTFLDNNDTNCTQCDRLCIQCEINSTYCSNCTLTGIFEAYLHNNQCVIDCPDQFYKETNNITFNECLPCDPSCFKCTGSPTPCQYCNLGFFLFQEACGGTCPAAYFPDDTTRKCLLCETHCVKLTLDMYFSSATNAQIYVDMIFSEVMDWNTFDYKNFQSFDIDNEMYTLEMFTFKYEILNSKTYRIIMEPKGYIFLYNATITVTTMDLPNILHRSQNNRPFRQSNYALSADLVWFVINAPNMSPTEENIINGLSETSDMISNFTTNPYVQELKKMGVFLFFFGGAQITSCSVLINNIPSQNLYEGVRFWALFVFFDVPKWQQNSDKTKYVVVPPVQDLVKNARMLSVSSEGKSSSNFAENGHQAFQRRLLFDTNSVEWRFARTGHTSFFIYDTYAMLFMIGLSWVLMLIGYCLNKKKPLLFKKHMGKFYSFLHKVHEIAILYIMLNTMLEWLYFQGNSTQRWVSLGFCLVFNVYFLAYELYCYYEMIKYPVAVIGNEKYEFYAIRYGCFLKNIRYVEYDMKEPWSPKHWFRPYNYHILSYYKKLLMVISLPIFYETIHAQAFILIFLQIFQILRFIFTWPFVRRWRNIVRLCLEIVLLVFFFCVMIQGYIVRDIMLNDQKTIEKSINSFYKFGWVAFTMVFVFNLSFVALTIFDIVKGCRKSNREMMDQARRVYYYDKIKAYEEENEDVPLGLVNKWVKLGNLNERNYDELEDVNIRVEYFRIAKNARSSSYEVEVKKLLDLYMNIEFNFQKDNNVSMGKKFNKRFTLTKDLSKNFYYIIDALYRKYDKQGVQYLTIKTFQKVQQSLYKPGDKIDLVKDRMSQRIEIEDHSGHKKVEKLPQLLAGFPIPMEDLQMIH